MSMTRSDYFIALAWIALAPHLPWLSGIGLFVYFGAVGIWHRYKEHQ